MSYLKIELNPVYGSIEFGLIRTIWRDESGNIVKTEINQSYGSLLEE